MLHQMQTREQVGHMFAFGVASLYTFFLHSMYSSSEFPHKA